MSTPRTKFPVELRFSSVPSIAHCDSHVNFVQCKKPILRGSQFPLSKCQNNPCIFEDRCRHQYHLPNRVQMIPAMGIRQIDQGLVSHRLLFAGCFPGISSNAITTANMAHSHSAQFTHMCNVMLSRLIIPQLV